MAEKPNVAEVATAGVTVPEPAPVPEAPPIRAKDVLGLEEAPAESIKAAGERAADIVKTAAKQVPLPPKAKPTPKPETKPAPKADPKPGAKPPASAEVKPAPKQEAKPEVKPAPKAEAKPEKVTVGGKEYTIQELEARLKQQEAPPPAPPPAPATAESPTAEQVRAQENEYAAKVGATLPVELTEQELDTMLLGGKDGAAAFVQTLQRTAARALLEARKSIFADVEPHIRELRAAVAPLLQSQEQLTRQTYEQVFTQAYPEYRGEHLEAARVTADLLVKNYPRECAALTPAQFAQEVDRQTDRMLQAEFKRWNPAGTTWKEHVRAQSSAPAVPATPATPEAPAAAVAAATPAAPAVPAAPTPPRLRPMATNTPAPPAGGARSFQKTVAAGLVD